MIIVIGQNPGLGKKALKTNTGGRLEEWMSTISPNRNYSFTNAYLYPGKVIKKNIDYDLLKKTTKEYSKVIALGNIASEALTKIKVDHFKLPHPSGLNRQLNDKTYVSKVLKDCNKYVTDEKKFS
tara:strand:- start:1126 stop:1500 length:375 start_codon:yes stop_codon:yes gene_type:complete